MRKLIFIVIVLLLLFPMSHNAAANEPTPTPTRTLRPTWTQRPPMPTLTASPYPGPEVTPYPGALQVSAVDGVILEARSPNGYVVLLVALILVLVVGWVAGRGKR